MIIYLISQEHQRWVNLKARMEAVRAPQVMIDNAQENIERLSNDLRSNALVSREKDLTNGKLLE